MNILFYFFLSIITLLIIIYFYIDPENFILYSNTGLGKFLAILLITLYAILHLGAGILVIIIILSYYKIYGYDSWSIINTADFLDGIDIIYYINLERSKDRREQMEKMFNNPLFLGKPIQRIQAIDGKDPNEKVFDKLVLNQRRNTKLEYSCLLSHLTAIRMFSESNLYENALIFEDDITLEFKKFWRKSLKSIIDEAPADWEIIQLCYITGANLRADYTLNNYQRNRYGGIASMAAYIINKKAAKKLMNEMYDPFSEKYTLANYHTHEADHYLYKVLKTYTYKYPYFIYPTINTSTLHPEDLNSHIRSKLRIENMYRGIYQ
jgi:GR25 family glycosyltransferase involved in LPS biosynthesis